MSPVDPYPTPRLVAPDEAWPRRYVEVAAELTAALGDAWHIEHVGSTSVPGLLAKPVIDVAARAPAGVRPAEVNGPLVEAGWTVPVVVGDHWATYRTDGDGVRTGIAHVFTAAQWSTAHPRLFAAWLRAHPADRDRYAALKQGLVSRGVWGGDYTAAKGDFVRDVVDQARAAVGLPPLTDPL